MKEALSSSETSVLTRATRRNIPEDTILQITLQFSLSIKTWSMILFIELKRQVTTKCSHLLHTGFLSGWFSDLKMEVIRSSETSVNVRTTRCYILEDGNIAEGISQNMATCGRYIPHDGNIADGRKLRKSLIRMTGTQDGNWIVQLSNSSLAEFQVFTEVTMKNVLWDIRTQFVPHWKHITSPLQSSAV
jgi:hypothetical protein